MIIKDKIIIYTALLGLCIYIVYILSSILAPFICAIILTYLLSPVADKLEKNTRFSRLCVTLLILGIFSLLIIVSLLTLLPLLYNQLSNLIESIPVYINIVQEKFLPKLLEILEKIGFKNDVESNDSNFLNKNITNILGISNNIFETIVKSSVLLMDFLSLIFITPILLFYFLKDWNVLVKTINSHLPNKYKSTIRCFFSNVDQTLSSYIRGQLNICLIIGIVYGISLTFAGLDFGFLIGFITGILSFIPYVGMFIGFSLSIIIALFQWGFDVTNISIIIVIFIFIQILESNFLTPKLIGKKVGLHPLWIIFGLFSFGSLFGFTGILLAVPMTSIVGVLVRMIFLKYQDEYKFRK